MNTLVVQRDKTVIDERTGAKLPARPNGHHSWSYETQQWIDRRPLSELKIEKLAQLQAALEGEDQQPLTTPAGTFKADRDAQSHLRESIMFLRENPGQGNAVKVSAADGKVQTLNANQMAKAYQLLLGRNQAAREKLVTLKAAVEAATNKDQLGAISW